MIHFNSLDVSFLLRHTRLNHFHSRTCETTLGGDIIPGGGGGLEENARLGC